MAFVVPPIQTRPAFLPQDVPQTRRQELAGLGAGYGYGSPVFRDPAAVDYYQNLLANTLLSPNGSVVSEDLGNLISPAERFALSQQLGFRPETTTELFTALGLGQPDPVTGETAPITREAIGNALRNLPTRIEEGGERQGAHPGTGDVTGIGRIGAPSISEGMLGSQVAPAAAIAAGLPGLAPAAAIGGLGLVGSSLAGALQDLTGRPGVIGPSRPQVGTQTFRDVVAAGEGGIGPSRSSIDNSIGGIGGGASGHPGFSRAGPTSQGDVRGGGTLGGTGADRDRGGLSGVGGIGGGASGHPGFSGGPDRSAFACGGLVKKHYADGGQIGMIDPSMMGPPMSGDPTYMPKPQNGVGPDDVSLTGQVGEFVLNKNAVEALGVEFLDVLNDIFLKNPDLSPKTAIKAASAMLPKEETSTKVEPGDLGRRIGSAVGQGSFARGGLIGSNPPRI